jgi:ABC-type Fe3+ transport system substrate-binding protein
MLDNARRDWESSDQEQVIGSYVNLSSETDVFWAERNANSQVVVQWLDTKMEFGDLKDESMLVAYLPSIGNFRSTNG